MNNNWKDIMLGSRTEVIIADDTWSGLLKDNEHASALRDCGEIEVYSMTHISPRMRGYRIKFDLGYVHSGIFSDPSCAIYSLHCLVMDEVWCRCIN